MKHSFLDCNPAVNTPHGTGYITEMESYKSGLVRYGVKLDNGHIWAFEGTAFFVLRELEFFDDREPIGYIHEPGCLTTYPFYKERIHKILGLQVLINHLNESFAWINVKKEWMK